MGHDQGKTIAWTLGNRNAQTFQKLVRKARHVKGRYFTDDWEVYAKILPKERHVMDKSGTTGIEK